MELEAFVDALMSILRLVPFTAWLIMGSLVVFAAFLYAAIRGLRSACVQQGRRFSRCRLTGREVVGRLLAHVGLPADRIDDGAKIDHYDFWRRRVRLRTESSVSASVAALAIAAHEVGHAEQFAAGYWAARATRWMLMLLVASGGVLFVLPFAAPVTGSGEVNLTGLVAVLAIFPVVRFPLTLALERDATKRAKRLLQETALADETEHAGIAQLLAAAFRTHLALSVGLILLVGSCVVLMSLVDSSLSMPLPTQMQVALSSEFDPGGHLPPIDAVHLHGLHGTYMYPVGVFASFAVAWWAIRSPAKKSSARSAIDANNDGMARYLAGDPAAAIAHIDEALQSDPGLAAAHYNRAVVLCSQGRNDLALASLDAVFNCRPEEIEPFLAIADLWYLRGTLRLDQGDYQGAVDDLSRAFDFDPADPSTLLSSRGLAWIKLGQLDRALADTDAALALTPDNAVAYNNRGVIHRDLGNLDQAEADLRRALDIDPNLPNPREHLARLLEAKR
jgi:Zn-dependent membrane protease YugP/Tfp pilus assembly protein PilF